MKKSVLTICLIGFVIFGATAFANDLPIPISAESAFDAVQTDRDPISGVIASVALVDVRSRAEYFWVGAACQVDEIFTAWGDRIFPDNGKTILSSTGRFLTFTLQGRKRRLPVRKVAEMHLSPIAISIPFKNWDDEKMALVENPNFKAEVEALSGDYDTLIFFCRSGGRSENCLADFDHSLFIRLYEIDQPDGTGGRGGFEGTSYGNFYNGYRGFPGRLTRLQPHPSVAWKDAGLPMKTSLTP